MYQFCQHINILDPVRTQHQLIQILEAFADELNIADIIVQQLQKLYLFSVAAARVQDLLQGQVIDVLTYQRYELLFLLVDALDELRQHEVVLGLDLGNVDDLGALVDGQLKDDEVVLVLKRENG